MKKNVKRIFLGILMVILVLAATAISVSAASTPAITSVSEGQKTVDDIEGVVLAILPATQDDLSEIVLIKVAGGEYALLRLPLPKYNDLVYRPNQKRLLQVGEKYVFTVVFPIEDYPKIISIGGNLVDGATEAVQL